MKLNTVLVLGTIFAASTVSANGGLNIDNINAVMNADQWTKTSVAAPAIVPQASVEAFVNYKTADLDVVDTAKLQQSYDGQS